MYLGIFLLIFLLLALIRVPIPFAMGIGAILTLILAGGSTVAIAQSMFRSINIFTFLAIPAFIFAPLSDIVRDKRKNITEGA